MKFADGFWLNQRGYEVNYASHTTRVMLTMVRTLFSRTRASSHR